MNRKRTLAFVLAALLALSLCACTLDEQGAVVEDNRPPVSLESPDTPVETGYSPAAKAAISDLIKLYGKNGYGYNGTAYVVSDFDNTITVFDITHQCVIYQLEHMAFAMDPEGLRTALSADLDLEANDNALWIEDILAAYSVLYESYGPFTPAGVDEETMEALRADPEWVEFSAKMRAFLAHVEDTNPEDVSYAWVLYWFSGMTEQEVYDLFYRSCSYYQDVESRYVTWTSPAELESGLGVVECTFTEGVSVPQDVKDMMRYCRDGGIYVWICSASHVDGVRAAVDAYGLSDVVTGVIGMTQQMTEEGTYAPAYDYETGFSYDNLGDGVWEKSAYAIRTIPTMEGKVEAVKNALMPRYGGNGPIAGFMDSNSDFNFCTEFASLKLVICYNHADRRITDGAGLLAVVAAYQQEVLGYDLAKANEEDDTLYILQGQDENGLRSLRASDHTLRLGATEPSLFANEDNQLLLDYARKHKLSTQQIIDGFCIATPANDFGNLLGVSHGHLTSYSGYHSIADDPAPEEEAQTAA